MEHNEQISQFPYMADDEETEIEEDEPLLDTDDEESNFIIKPTQCRGCTVYIEPLLFVIMFTQFPLFILTPQYVLGRELKKLTGNEYIKVNANSCIGQAHHNETYLDHNNIVHGNYTLAQSAASLFQLQITIVSSIPAMIVVMFIGPYSDKRGRKIAIILPLIGGMISSLIFLLDIYFEWPMELLLIANFIHGCTGHWTMLFMGCLAFIADVTTKEKRQFRMVLLEICITGPSILSAFGSGFLLSSLGFTLVYFIAFLISILTLLYAIFVVPETVKYSPGVKPFSTDFIKKSINVFTQDHATKRRWKLLMLFGALFFYFIADLSKDTDTLFMMNYPLCWNSTGVGMLVSVRMAVAVVGSAITAKIFSYCLRDVGIAIIGGLIPVGLNIYMFFVTTSAMMFGSAAFSLTGLLFAPTIRAMISNLVQPDEIGAVYGGLAFVQVLCLLVGNAIFNPIYSATQYIGLPSAVYLSIGSTYLLGVIIMITYAVCTRKEPPSPEPL